MLNYKAVFILSFFLFFIQFNKQVLASTNDSIPNQFVSETKQQNLDDKINNVFAPIVDKMGEILFWDPFTAMGICLELESGL
jgi:hypothetical protein